jgi:hypothetical protein
MNKIIVYHGGTEAIENPDCKLGRKNLDFGQGFYVTDIREQAVKWAENMGRNRNKPALLNSYIMNRQAIVQEARCKIFEAYNEEWLEFIIANRTGENIAAKYDYIEGGIANDRVIDTVNLYTAGLMELNTALRELSRHQPNNQMCLLSQSIINEYLIYNGTEEL